MNFRKNSRGITLIALVITIIVLIILAGVTLNIVTGSNGIIGKTEKTVIAANEESIREDAELLMSDWYTDYYMEEIEIEGRSGTTGAGAQAIYSRGKLRYTKDGKTYILSINNGNIGKVEEENEKNSQSYAAQHPEKRIPTGFTYKEGTVDEGYVITDGTNEFVWIPIASPKDYEKKLGTNNWFLRQGTTEWTTQPPSSFSSINEALKGDVLGDVPAGKIVGQTVTTSLANQPEAEIVNKAGGFWVGRYEAGLASALHNDIAGINGITWEWDSASATKSDTYWESKKSNIVVKQDTEPVRNITQSEALKIANNWKKGVADESKGTVAFQSGLITGTRMGYYV